MSTSRVGRFDAFQRRHRVLGFPIAVFYKFFDDQGSYLAALITYYGFVSLFPLLLLLVTILGFVLQAHQKLRGELETGIFGQVPQLGDYLQNSIDGLSGSTVALIVGIVGALYGGLGVAQAAQNALNKVWAVPRNARPNPIKARGRSLILLFVIGFGIIVVTAFSQIGLYAGDIGVDFSGFFGAIAPVLQIIANMALFVLAFHMLTVHRARVRDTVPGAVLAALGFKGLQSLGSYYLAHLSRTDAVYGVFAVVLGLIAWIYLVAFVLVLCAEVNAVLAGRLWPRALLTPFTDNVDLTTADRKAYSSYSKTERFKGYQRIDVEWPEVTTGPHPLPVDQPESTDRAG